MQTERQKEIISSALEIISEAGIQGFTIKSLAAKIGISEPAIYRHYNSKIAILIAILDDFKSRSYIMFSDAAQGSESSIHKIVMLFENHFREFAEMPTLSSVIFSEEIFRNDESLKLMIGDVIQQNHAILMQIITKGQQNGEIRVDIEAQQLSVMIMGSLRLFIKKWQLLDYSFDLQKEGAKIIQMIKLLIR